MMTFVSCDHQKELIEGAASYQPYIIATANNNAVIDTTIVSPECKQSLTVRNNCGDADCDAVFGTSVGIYQGIEAFNNASYFCNCGLTEVFGTVSAIKYQCVHYDRNFFWNVFRINFPMTGNAAKWSQSTFTIPSNCVRYNSDANFFLDSTIAYPQPGDALVFKQSSSDDIGHIAVSKGNLIIIQQNFTESTADGNYALKKERNTKTPRLLKITCGKYMLAAIIRPNYSVQGTAPLAHLIWADAITTTTANLKCQTTWHFGYRWQIRVKGTTTWSAYQGTNSMSFTGLKGKTAYEYRLGVPATPTSIAFSWTEIKSFTTL